MYDDADASCGVVGGDANEIGHQTTKLTSFCTFSAASWMWLEASTTTVINIAYHRPFPPVSWVGLLLDIQLLDYQTKL